MVKGVHNVYINYNLVFAAADHGGATQNIKIENPGIFSPGIFAPIQARHGGHSGAGIPGGRLYDPIQESATQARTGRDSLQTGAGIIAAAERLRGRMPLRGSQRPYTPFLCFAGMFTLATASGRPGGFCGVL